MSRLIGLAVLFAASVALQGCGGDDGAVSGGGDDGAIASDGAGGTADIVTASDDGADGRADVGVADAGDVGKADAASDSSADAPSSEVTPTDTPADSATPDTMADEGPPPVPCTAGLFCDDGDPCTMADQCVDGLCEGDAYACDDGRPCTDDVCDGHGGCSYPISEGTCLINNLCYQTGETSRFNPCVACEPSVTTTAFVVRSDGSACGGDDPCLEEGVCARGSCEAAASGCDDGNACTDDVCDPVMGCVHEPNFDACEDGDPCTVGDQCTDGGCVGGLLPLDCDDDNPCTVDRCTPEGCTNENAALPCDDGSVCTEGDACVDGACVAGPAVSCNDGNDCTTDSCHPTLRCQHEVLQNACCIGQVHICNDSDPCTVDVCNPEADAEAGEPLCTNEPTAGLDCSDGDACTAGDACDAAGACASGPPRTCDDENTCTVDRCDPARGCVFEPDSSATCDDGSACTQQDRCLANGVCTGTALRCDDGNPCTRDLCRPIEGCVFEVREGACSDGDVCTTGDTCVDGRCEGAPRRCDDGNPCTADSCHPAAGCQSDTIAAACDDGDECTLDDRCSDGRCMGTAAQVCCTPEFTSPATKVVDLALGEDGHAGNALDVDGNPSTCAPAGQCSGGRDNSLAPMGGLGNEPLAEALEKGEVNVIFELRGSSGGDGSFELALFQGEPVDAGCDVQRQSCDYWVPEDTVTTECEPAFVLAPARIVGDRLTAGGVGSIYPLQLPLNDSTILDLSVVNAQVEATLTRSGGRITEMNGILGGAVPKAAIVAAIQEVPDDELPVPRGTILSLLNLIIKNDIDRDGDGTKDSASVGVRFRATPATIQGVEP